MLTNCCYHHWCSVCLHSVMVVTKVRSTCMAFGISSINAFQHPLSGSCWPCSIFPHDGLWLRQERQSRVAVVGGLAHLRARFLFIRPRLHLDNTLCSFLSHGLFHGLVCHRCALRPAGAELHQSSSLHYYSRHNVVGSSIRLHGAFC